MMKMTSEDPFSDKDFFPGIDLGQLVTIGGLTGMGKTYWANYWNDPDLTFFIDTHGTFSTIETLHRLGQNKVWRATEWGLVLEYTKRFLKFMKKSGKKGTLVLDSGSEMVTMAQNYVMARDGLKGVMNEKWGRVWKVIMEFLGMVVEAGHDLILTLQLKRTYDEKLDANDNRVLIWNGEWEAKQWKDLPYQVTISIQLESGIYIADRKKEFLPEYGFAKLVKSRYVRKSKTKPYIVGPVSKASVMPQVQTEYNGNYRDIVYESYLLTKENGDDAFAGALSSIYGLPPKGYDPKSVLGIANTNPLADSEINETSKSKKKQAKLIELPAPSENKSDENKEDDW